MISGAIDGEYGSDIKSGTRHIAKHAMDSLTGPLSKRETWLETWCCSGGGAVRKTVELFPKLTRDWDSLTRIREKVHPDSGTSSR